MKVQDRAVFKINMNMNFRDSVLGGKNRFEYDMDISVSDATFGAKPCDGFVISQRMLYRETCRQ